MTGSGPVVGPSGPWVPDEWGGSPSGARPAGVSGYGTGIGAALMMLIGTVFFVAVLLVVAALFVVAIVASLCVVAVRGVVHAVNPHARKGPVTPGAFRPAAVIDTTARVVRSAGPASRHPR